MRNDNNPKRIKRNSLSSTESRYVEFKVIPFTFSPTFHVLQPNFLSLSLYRMCLMYYIEMCQGPSTMIYETPRIGTRYLNLDDPLAQGMQVYHLDTRHL